MTIHEPATLLTDCLLGMLASGLAWRIRSGMSAHQASARWWSGALALTALSAFVGGSYHGFAPNFPPNVAEQWWRATLLIICGMSIAMAMSLLHEFTLPAKQRLWRWLIASGGVVFAGASLVHPEFVVAIAAYGLAMLAWVAAALLTRRTWRGWMLAGVGLSILAALVQQLHWGLSASFNHNDLYHVVQALALVAFYRASRGFSGPAPQLV